MKEPKMKQSKWVAQMMKPKNIITNNKADKYQVVREKGEIDVPLELKTRQIKKQKEGQHNNKNEIRFKFKSTFNI